jgi:hypothetical protein
MPWHLVRGRRLLQYRGVGRCENSRSLSINEENVFREPKMKKLKSIFEKEDGAIEICLAHNS